MDRVQSAVDRWPEFAQEAGVPKNKARESGKSLNPKP